MPERLRGPRKVSNSQPRDWAIFLHFVYAIVLVHYSPAALSETTCIVNSAYSSRSCRRPTRTRTHRQARIRRDTVRARACAKFLKSERHVLISSPETQYWILHKRTRENTLIIHGRFDYRNNIVNCNVPGNNRIYMFLFFSICTTHAARMCTRKVFCALQTILFFNKLFSVSSFNYGEFLEPIKATQDDNCEQLR